MAEKILVAMSGGVDSSAAVLLLQEWGIACEGAVMRLFLPQGAKKQEGEDDAREVCEKLGIPFSVFDCREEFRSKVIGDFTDCYIKGETPNPCVICNKYLKFGLFLDKALEAGFDKIATGHYAKVIKIGKRYTVKRAAFANKDQSYMLWSLSQRQLSHAVFPLGDLTKDEVRNKTAEASLDVSGKKESQDICFVPDGDYSSFIINTTGADFPAGDFVSENGTVIGRHKGIIHYTVGQRRGLGLSLKASLYVKSKNAAENKIVLSPDENLFSKKLSCRAANFTAVENISSPLRVFAKIRYRHEGAPATVYPAGGDRFTVEFDTPQRAVSPGQSCVLYDEAFEYIVGGGIISAENGEK